MAVTLSGWILYVGYTTHVLDCNFNFIIQLQVELVGSTTIKNLRRIQSKSDGRLVVRPDGLAVGESDPASSAHIPFSVPVQVLFLFFSFCSFSLSLRWLRRWDLVFAPSD
jgi:hypothetical protein